MSARRICCAAYGGGHIRAVLPVLRAMEERGWHVTLLALTIAAQVAREASFRALTAADFLEPTDGKIREYGEALAKELPSASVLPREESVAYLGFGFAGLVEKLGSAAAKAAYRERGRSALYPTLLVERLLDRSRPDVVLATNSPRAERLLIERAGGRGIPAVCLNDLLAPADDAWLFDPGFADRICVLNSYVRDRFIAFGQDPAKLVMTGNPAFASLMRYRHRDRRCAGKLRVLYISQSALRGDEVHMTRFRAALLALARSRPDFSITVRPHPGETDTAWIVAPLRCEEPGLTVEQSLENADVVVSHGSTMALEASLVGLPVVMDIESRVAERAPLHLAGFAYPTSSCDRLGDDIDHAVSRGPVEIADMPYDPVGAVAAVIEQLAA